MGLAGDKCPVGQNGTTYLELQTGNVHGTVPLYLGETDFGGIVQPVYTVSICMSVDLVDVPQSKPPAQARRGGHQNCPKKCSKRWRFNKFPTRYKNVCDIIHIFC